MVRHIVLWNINKDFDKAQAAEAASGIKSRLEALLDKIPGVISINVNIMPLDTSNRAVMLDSLFTDEASFRAYLEHPEHKKAGVFVRSVVEERASFDYAMTL